METYHAAFQFVIKTYHADGHIAAHICSSSRGICSHKQQFCAQPDCTPTSQCQLECGSCCSNLHYRCWQVRCTLMWLAAAGLQRLSVARPAGGAQEYYIYKLTAPLFLLASPRRSGASPIRRDDSVSALEMAVIHLLCPGVRTLAT